MKGVSAITHLGDPELGCISRHLAKKNRDHRCLMVFSEQLNGHLALPLRKILLFDFIIRSTKCLLRVFAEYNIEGI